jgi:hypothetical protein
MVKAVALGRLVSYSIKYLKVTSYSPFRSFFTVEIWQCRFAAECVAEVPSRVLTAEAPSYASIMELDRKVREFPLPEGMVSSSDDLAGSFQKCVLDHTISETCTDIFLSFKINQVHDVCIVLMYIHRSFFAQAIIKHPVNLRKSTYAPSFLAAYRASSTILKSIREQFNMWPNSCSRFWTMWTSAFSVAVCIFCYFNETKDAYH